MPSSSFQRRLFTSQSNIGGNIGTWNHVMEYCCQFLFCFGDCIWGSGRLFAYESARSCVEYFYRDTEDEENMLRRVSGTQALRQCLCRMPVCPTVCRWRDSAGASYLTVPLCPGHTNCQKPSRNLVRMGLWGTWISGKVRGRDSAGAAVERWSLEGTQKARS